MAILCPTGNHLEEGMLQLLGDGPSLATAYGDAIDSVLEHYATWSQR